MRFAVYLLCRDGLDGHPEHYVGITTPSRVAARMIEHRSGRGAKWTKEAWEQGRSWFHTNTFLTNTRALEGALQRYRNVIALCPRCMDGVEFPPHVPYPKHPGLGESGVWGFPPPK